MLVSASALIVHGVEHRSLMLVSALDLDSDVMRIFFLFFFNPSIQEEY